MQVCVGSGKRFNSVKTAGIAIPPLSEETISGYWDTSGLVVGDYDINVVLHQEGRTSEKLFETVVSADSIVVKEPSLLAGQVTEIDKEGGRYTLLIILVGILIVVNIGLFIYFRSARKK